MTNQYDPHSEHEPDWQGSLTRAGGGGRLRPPHVSRDMDGRFWLQIAAIVALVAAIPYFIYQECRIDVKNSCLAILTHKVGKDLDPGVVIAPSEEYKGVQADALREGRYYYNPYAWDWQVVPQVEVPEGKLGVRIRMYGEDLPAGQLIAEKDRKRGSWPTCSRRVAIRSTTPSSSTRRERMGRPCGPRRDAAELRRDHRVARAGDDSRRLQGTADKPGGQPAEATQSTGVELRRAGRADRGARAGHALLEPVRAGSPPDRLPQPAVQPYGHRFSDQGRFLGEPRRHHRVPREAGEGRHDLYPLQRGAGGQEPGRGGHQQGDPAECPGLHAGCAARPTRARSSLPARRESPSKRTFKGR